ncbi:MAG: HD domain-containing protein, partial [Ignavibacteriaceae bacterium]
MNEDIINKAHQYVQNIFNEHAPPENVYHNLNHTTEVVAAVKEIAAADGVGDDDLELLIIAAWFHDSGYVKICKGHEEVSIGYVKEFLNTNNYPEDKAEKIISLIQATKIPQSPKNHLEEILCDADLHHLGTKSFEEKGDLFRLEIENRGDDL